MFHSIEDEHGTRVTFNESHLVCVTRNGTSVTYHLSNGLRFATVGDERAADFDAVWHMNRQRDNVATPIPS